MSCERKEKHWYTLGISGREKGWKKKKTKPTQDNRQTEVPTKRLRQKLQEWGASEIQRSSLFTFNTPIQYALVSTTFSVKATEEVNMQI